MHNAPGEQRRGGCSECSVSRISRCVAEAQIITARIGSAHNCITQNAVDEADQQCREGE